MTVSFRGPRWGIRHRSGRADRAPGWCRAGGGLIGGKAPSALSHEIRHPSSVTPVLDDLSASHPLVLRALVTLVPTVHPGEPLLLSIRQEARKVPAQF